MQIKLVKYTDIDDYENEIMLNFGKTSETIVNTIRRIMLTKIPIYTYDYIEFKTQGNTSIYNNTQLAERVGLFPVPNIYFNNSEINPRSNTLKYTDNLSTSIKSEIPILRMFVNVVNESPDKNYIRNVTTDDAQFVLYGRQVEKVYNAPLLICKLKYKEQISFVSDVTKLGIASLNSKWSPLSVCASYKEDESENCILKYGAHKQLAIKEYAIRACIIIIDITTNVIKTIIEKIKESKKDEALEKWTVYLENETQTMGELLTYFLRNNENVDFVGYRINDFFSTGIHIEYRLKKSKITDVLQQCKTEIIDTYLNIQNQMEQIKI